MNDHELKLKIGNRLREERIRHGYKNQTAIADKLKISQQTYSTYENGISRIPIEISHKLKELDFEMWYVENGDNYTEDQLNETIKNYGLQEVFEMHKRQYALSKSSNSSCQPLNEIELKIEMGARLKEERRRLGYLNQTIFAKEDIKINQGTYSAYENGTRTIPFELLNKLQKMGFDRWYIETGTRDMMSSDRKEFLKIKTEKEELTLNVEHLKLELKITKKNYEKLLQALKGKK